MDLPYSWKRQYGKNVHILENEGSLRICTFSWQDCNYLCIYVCCIFIACSIRKASHCRVYPVSKNIDYMYCVYPAWADSKSETVHLKVGNDTNQRLLYCSCAKWWGSSRQFHTFLTKDLQLRCQKSALSSSYPGVGSIMISISGHDVRPSSAKAS